MMFKARTWLTLGLLSFGTLAATVSCGGSDEATGTGSAGTMGGLIGGGAGGTTAVGRGGSGGASTGGSGGGTGGAAPVTNLGMTCAADADCGTGLICLLASSTSLSVGGPAGGLCTLACANNGDCDAFVAGARCVGNMTQAYCFEACAPGALPDPTDASSKCHGRADMACAGFSSSATGAATETLCSPRCETDAQCGKSLFCDPNSGECIKTAPTGDPVGTVCDPSAATDGCRGACIGTDPNKDTVGACFDFCSLGEPCSFVGTKPGGICFGELTTADGSTPGPHDLGICEQNCNCDADCKVAGEKCAAWTSTAVDQAAKKLLGANGFCTQNTTGTTELKTCGSGGSGGTGGMMGEAGAGGAAGAP